MIIPIALSPESLDQTAGDGSMSNQRIPIVRLDPTSTLDAAMLVPCGDSADCPRDVSSTFWDHSTLEGIPGTALHPATAVPYWLKAIFSNLPAPFNLIPFINAGIKLKLNKSANGCIWNAVVPDGAVVTGQYLQVVPFGGGISPDPTRSIYLPATVSDTSPDGFCPNPTAWQNADGFTVAYTGDGEWDVQTPSMSGGWAAELAQWVDGVPPIPICTGGQVFSPFGGATGQVKAFLNHATFQNLQLIAKIHQDVYNVNNRDTGCVQVVLTVQLETLYVNEDFTFGKSYSVSVWGAADVMAPVDTFPYAMTGFFIPGDQEQIYAITGASVQVIQDT